MKGWKYLILAVVVVMIASACNKESTSSSSGGSTSPSGEIQKGGTLVLASEADVDHAFDPNKEYSSLAFEMFRCCLARTLISTNGMDADNGGSTPMPDLAEALPTMSADGLTYTFKLKQGIHYAPPLQDVEVKAADFERSLSRQSIPAAASGGYPFYYSETGGTGCGIEGFDAAKGGDISGVTEPDDYTLTIKVSAPCGDFPWRMSMPATAPIPPVGDAPLGAAEGHTKDYGRFQISTGPYMFEGTDMLDPTLPVDEQKPVSGYVPDRSWTLVRNPSWDASTDSNRPAYVDEIDVAIGGTARVLADQIDQGTIDFELGGVPPADQIQSYQSQGKEGQIYAFPSDGVRYLSMNLALAPFDDIHVRKAMNWIMDKDALRRTRGGPMFGEIAGHYFVPSMLPGVNEGYDPYATPNSAGDLEKAKAEMMQSKYDTNQDGVCDAPECKDVLMITDNADPYPQQSPIIVSSAKKIGVELTVQSGDRYTFMYDKCLDPSSQAGFCPAVGWFKDYPDVLTFGPPTLGSAAIGPSGCCNYSLVGASPQVLKKAGYTVTDVPSLDATFDKCVALPTGSDRDTCWGDADKAIMETVVPVIPWLWDNDVTLVGDRIVNYTYDQSAGLPALDHLALKNGGA